MEIQLYKALVSAGVSDQTAVEVVDALEKSIHERINDAKAELVTRSYLDAKLMEAKLEIIKWNLGAIIATAGLAVAIAKIVH